MEKVARKEGLMHVKWMREGGLEAWVEDGGEYGVASVNKGWICAIEVRKSPLASPCTARFNLS